MFGKPAVLARFRCTFPGPELAPGRRLGGYKMSLFKTLARLWRGRRASVLNNSVSRPGSPRRADFVMTQQIPKPPAGQLPGLGHPMRPAAGAEALELPGQSLRAAKRARARHRVSQGGPSGRSGEGLSQRPGESAEPARRAQFFGRVGDGSRQSRRGVRFPRAAVGTAERPGGAEQLRQRVSLVRRSKRHQNTWSVRLRSIRTSPTPGSTSGET